MSSAAKRTRHAVRCQQQQAQAAAELEQLQQDEQQQLLAGTATTAAALTDLPHDLLLHEILPRLACPRDLLSLSAASRACASLTVSVFAYSGWMAVMERTGWEGGSGQLHCGDQGRVLCVSQRVLVCTLGHVDVITAAHTVRKWGL